MVMKAIVIHEYGPPDVLSYEEVPVPIPRAGEIRVRVHGATVNRVLDVSLRAGRETARGPVLPLIPGVDCAGVVDAVGPEVSRWRVGDRVAAEGVMPLDICAEDGSAYSGQMGMLGINRPGAFAELVILPACAAAAVPERLDFHRAAVVMRHVPTAWNLLVRIAQLKRGETALIMGAGGNLGTIGIQIAKNVIGATVIAVAGSDERVTLALKLGADHGINYAKQNIFDEVMRITGGKGINVLYDNVANPAVLPLAFRSIGMRGRRTCRTECFDRLRASLSQAHHRQRRPRPFGLGPAALPRRRGGREDHAAGRARVAAVPRSGCASLGRSE
jgi:NADPH:quinone reductase